MSRTIGYNPDPTLNARQDPKGPFRSSFRVMEAMPTIVGHSQHVTHAPLWQTSKLGRGDASASADSEDPPEAPPAAAPRHRPGAV